MSIAIVNYGAGNLRSVSTALARLGREGVITADRRAILEAGALVLPGVGAAGAAMDRLHSTGLDEIIGDFVKTGKALLGICLGMQLLLAHHDEDDVNGLGLIAGTVPRFGVGLKVPHMGWNRVHQRHGLKLFEGIRDGSYFYFVHSFFALPEDPASAAGETEYGVRFASVIARDNIFGTQFHPEKSGDDGLRLLNNFLEVSGKC